MNIEPATCPVCHRHYDPLRARAVLVEGGRVRAFCSTGCKERAARGDLSDSDRQRAMADDDHAELMRKRSATRSAIAMVAAAAMAATILGGVLMARRGGKKMPALALASAPIIAPTPAPAPPPDSQSLFGDSGGDIWFHPLLGPARQLPEKASRRFGAPRDGMRPDACRDGHCGVDIGLEKGAPVMAAHDGVIERVVRDPEQGGRRGNEGRFIRINHRGGLVVTSYIHLEGIRGDLKPGLPVKAGEIIGTVGDTGVQHSGPHLHFAVSVRRTPEAEELFIDPEPLLQLWPVRTVALATLQPMEASPPPRRAPQKTARLASSTSEEL